MNITGAALPLNTVSVERNITSQDAEATLPSLVQTSATAANDASDTPQESSIVTITPGVVDLAREENEAATSASGEEGNRTTEATPLSAKSVLTPAENFTYGVLGLEHPDDTSHPTDSYYSAGRWLAAAATVGTMISLLV